MLGEGPISDLAISSNPDYRGPDLDPHGVSVSQRLSTAHTLDGVTSAGTGIVVNPVTGTGSSTLAGVTSAGTGSERFIATGASTLTGVTSAGTGSERMIATGASTLAGVTSAGSGVVANPVTGTGASTLAGVTSAGTGAESFLGNRSNNSRGRHFGWIWSSR